MRERGREGGNEGEREGGGKEGVYIMICMYSGTSVIRTSINRCSNYPASKVAYSN